MCQECIALDKQIQEENDAVGEAFLDETLNRIVGIMETNPNWMEVARKEIREAIETQSVPKRKLEIIK